MKDEAGKEFSYTNSDFYRLSKLAKDLAGIHFVDAKRELVYGRLQKRVRHHNMKSFKQYCDYLEEGDNDEASHFLNAITTNVTSFFRENHHFEFLSKRAFPEILDAQSKSTSKRLRIWSAGCSSGKEPYSIAMVLRESVPGIQSWDARILATDVDSNVLEQARQGIFTEDHVKDLSPERRKRWFKTGTGVNESSVRISSEIRDLVYFKHLNFNNEWPMKGLFDCVFYRNVAIYFSRETQIKIVDRMANLIKPGGYLFVGHSESLFGVTDRFESLGQTIYRKLL